MLSMVAANNILIQEGTAVQQEEAGPSLQRADWKDLLWCFSVLGCRSWAGQEAEACPPPWSTFLACWTLTASLYDVETAAGPSPVLALRQR